MNASQAKQPKTKRKLNAKRSRGPRTRSNPTNRNNKPGMQRQVAAPVSIGVVTKIAGPKYRASKNGSVCISHKELIGDVNGSVNFSVLRSRINPGLSTMFPWLSSVAPNYESYKFKRLHFKYVPSCSTSATGVVYLTVEFDPQDSIPTSERQIASYDGAVTGSVWTRHEYNCAARNLHKRSSYFVRNGTVPDNELQLYDVGYVIGATSGNADNSLLGKLWVEYEVELITPQLNDLAVGNSLSLFSTGAGKVIPVNTGNAPLVSSINGSVITYTATAPYQALVAYNIAGTGLTNPPVGGTATSTAKALVVNGASTVSVAQYTVSFNEGDTLTFDLTASTSITNYFIRFGQYNVTFG